MLCVCGMHLCLYGSPPMKLEPASMDALTLALVVSGSTIGALLCCCCCAVCCVWRRAFGRGCRHKRHSNPDAPCVLLLGDSITQGTLSASWGGELAKRFPSLNFVNTAINGDPSYQVLTRLPECIMRPEVKNLKMAILLVGTNDAIAMLNPLLAGALYKEKGVPGGKLGPWYPTVDIYERQVINIIFYLQQEGAEVIVVSPPPLGDVLPPAPVPSHPRYGLLSHLPNGLLTELAAAAKRAVETPRWKLRCTYVPFFEELAGRIPAALASSGREAESFNARIGQIAKAAGSVLRYACGTPWDALSSSVFTHDAIHLNERGCGVLVELLSPLLEPLSTAAASAQSLQDPLQQ